MYTQHFTGLAGYGIRNIRTDFSDNFDRADAAAISSPWMYTRNNYDWAIESGKLKSVAANQPCYVKISPDFDASVKLYNATPHGFIVARMIDATHFVYLAQDHTYLKLAYADGGAPVTIQSKVLTFVDGAEIRLVCKGNKFYCYYDGTFHFESTFTNSTYQTSSFVGLAATAPDMYFDDFSVKDIS